MEAIVEKMLPKVNYDQLHTILMDISDSLTEDELRENMKDSKESELITEFDYGFGNSHMWVKHKSSDSRLIFVKF